MRVGIPQVYEPDRERMSREMSRDFLTETLAGKKEYDTICRFYAEGRPVWCRVRAARDISEQGNLVISIRNVDREIRLDRAIVSRWNRCGCSTISARCTRILCIMRSVRSGRSS